MFYDGIKNELQELNIVKNYLNMLRGNDKDSIFTIYNRFIRTWSVTLPLGCNLGLLGFKRSCVFVLEKLNLLTLMLLFVTKC